MRVVEVAPKNADDADDEQPHQGATKRMREFPADAAAAAIRGHPRKYSHGRDRERENLPGEEMSFGTSLHLGRDGETRESFSMMGEKQWRWQFRFSENLNEKQSNMCLKKLGAWCVLDA